MNAAIVDGEWNIVIILEMIIQELYVKMVRYFLSCLARLNTKIITVNVDRKSTNSNHSLWLGIYRDESLFIPCIEETLL